MLEDPEHDGNGSGGGAQGMANPMLMAFMTVSVQRYHRRHMMMEALAWNVLVEVVKGEEANKTAPLPPIQIQNFRKDVLRLDDICTICTAACQSLRKMQEGRKEGRKEGR